MRALHLADTQYWLRINLNSNVRFPNMKDKCKWFMYVVCLQSGLTSMKSQRSPGSSGGRRSPTRSTLRSPKAPWVPAPGKTTRGNRVTFEVSIVI